MGIRALGLDLHQGFNCLTNSILEASKNEEADLCFSHPPYGPMVRYSGHVWGEAHQGDLSRCDSFEDFCTKMELVLLNQREATKRGGHYGMLIGDYRKNGEYFSYQAELIARMPKSELAAVIIKAQHNTTSGRAQYTGMKYPRILHEYAVLWKRADSITSWLGLLAHSLVASQRRMAATWSVIVQHALVQLGGRATLADLYQAVSQAAPEKLSNNQNWKPKVRQTLQLHQALFKSLGEGEWSLAA